MRASNNTCKRSTTARRLLSKKDIGFLKQKIFNGKKAALKERYWVPEEDDTYDLERLRRG
ncbi:hypothetical protein Tco_0735533, partial [Tanacetum coccineum]